MIESPAPARTADIIVCRDVHKWFGQLHVLRGIDTTVRTLMILPMMAAISPSLTLWALLPVLGLPAVMLVLGGAGVA